MAAFDTNVVVRVLVGDDPAQTKKAERAFVAHARGDGVFLSLVVLAEVGWVLKTAYEWDRETIHARLSQLVRTRGVLVGDMGVVDEALATYRAGRADLADYLTLAEARRAPGRELVTFDRKLAREPDATLL